MLGLQLQLESLQSQIGYSIASYGERKPEHMVRMAVQEGLIQQQVRTLGFEAS